MSIQLPRTAFLVIILALASSPARADDPDKRFPLFAYLTGKTTPALITYTPSQLDPRQEINQPPSRHQFDPASRPRCAAEAAFDGLILYGYNEAATPCILAVAKELKYRAVILALWDPKSAAEADGVAELVRQFGDDFVLGVLVGNEGITFKPLRGGRRKFVAAAAALEVAEDGSPGDERAVGGLRVGLRARVRRLPGAEHSSGVRPSQPRRRGSCRLGQRRGR